MGGGGDSKPCGEISELPGIACSCLKPIPSAAQAPLINIKNQHARINPTADLVYRRLKSQCGGEKALHYYYKVLLVGGKRARRLFLFFVSKVVQTKPGTISSADGHLHADNKTVATILTFQNCNIPAY